MRHTLKPKLFTLLKEEKYSFQTLYKDLFAGIVVGILSLSVTLAFTIASNVRPERGLYAAIIAGIVVALFGGARVQISGPTGSLALLIVMTTSQFGYDGLVIATFLAGIFLLIMSFARVGTLIKFIPYPVVIGLTSGLALILFINRIPDFLGYSNASLPKDFFLRCYYIIKNFSKMDFFSIIFGSFSLLIIIFWPKYVKKIPGSLIAIIFTTLIVYIFNLPVEVLSDRFGEIKSALPTFFIPKLSWTLVMNVIPSSIAIALLVGMEALLSCVVADGMMSKRHRSDAELLAQGLSNIFCSLFQGIPTTGTISRTAACIKSGGTTPFAAIFNVLTIGVIFFFFGKYISFIPLTTLAAVIMIVAYNMCEWRVFAKLFLSPKRDIAVLLVTFFLTVCVDLITAVEVGVILSMFLFISNLVNSSKINSIKQSLDQTVLEDQNSESFLKDLPESIEVFEVTGPLFFAAAEKFKMTLTRINRVPKVLILRLKYVQFIDATAIRALEDILHKCKTDKTVLILSGVNLEVTTALMKVNFINKIGKENIFSKFSEAISYSKTLLKQEEMAKQTVAINL